MTTQELSLQVRELGFTFGFHQAMSGSQYITVDGVQFRISDHYQPSHYQIRNYTDVSSFEDIIKIVSAEDFNKKEVEIVELDGKMYEVEYDDAADNFTMTLIED